MFRVSQFVDELLKPPALVAPGRRRQPAGPVVIWNLIRRCNLTCKHCYSISADTDFAGELSTDEAFRVMDDLKAARVPVLILSGGEPLLRPDIFTLARRAKELGFYVGLSSNGTLMDEAMAQAIAQVGFDYVGVSLDGIGATHDRFRRKEGAFAASLAGLRRCRDLGIKVGLRYTMTEENAQDFQPLLQLMGDEGIQKFYFSHLNYAGRGNRNRRTDAHHRTTRLAMTQLFETCLTRRQAGFQEEYVTGNQDADGVYFLLWARQRFPDQEEALRGLARRLYDWGGNASGVNVANIDNLGIVHPDTMWWNVPLGNVRERAFGDIWSDLSHPLMAGLKRHPRVLGGRCGQCRYLALCNGSSRVRALQVHGDPWAEDPACYLDDEELGIPAQASPAGPVRESTGLAGQRFSLELRP